MEFQWLSYLSFSSLSFLDPRVWLDQRKKNTVVHYTKASQLDRRSKKPPQFKSQPAAIALNPLNIETTERNIESQ